MSGGVGRGYCGLGLKARFSDSQKVFLDIGFPGLTGVFSGFDSQGRLASGGVGSYGLTTPRLRFLVI